MRGQLSAEMLILMALILGLIFIAYTQLNKSVTKAATSVDTQSDQLLNATKNCDQDPAACDSMGSTYECVAGRCVQKTS
jgi:uncharacterized protein (UPF0333 family)